MAKATKNTKKKSAAKKPKNSGLTKEEQKLKLTPNEEMFVYYLIQGDSRRLAYKKAYPNCNASDSVVDVKAYNVFNRDKVRIRYNTWRQELAKQRLDEAIILGKKAEAELLDIAFGNKKFTEIVKGEEVERYPTIGERLRALIELRKDYGEIVRAQAEADANAEAGSLEVKIEVVE